MFFLFWFHKNKNDTVQIEEKRDEAIDGEYRILEQSDNYQKMNKEKNLIIDDIDIVDLDKEHEDGKQKLMEAYKTIGLDECPATEARIKQAYYEKRQEIREYHLSGENKLLLDLRKAYELIISYPDEFLQQDSVEKQNSIEDEVESVEDSINEELFPWDEVMDAIDSEHKQKRKRKKMHIVALTVVIFAVIVLTAMGLMEINHIKDCESVLSNEEIIGYLSSEPINLDYGQKLVISENDISKCEKRSCFYIPFLRIYGQKTDFFVQINDAEMSMTNFLLYKYILKSDNKLEYMPLANIPCKTQVHISLAGTWTGSYKASAESNAASNLVIELIEDEAGILTGVCEIEADNGKKGSHYVSVTTIPGTLETSIKGTEWINKPAFFIMSDLEAYYDFQSKALLPTKKNGPVFLLTKEK